MMVCCSFRFFCSDRLMPGQGTRPLARARVCRGARNQCTSSSSRAVDLQRSTQCAAAVGSPPGSAPATSSVPAPPRVESASKAVHSLPWYGARCAWLVPWCSIFVTPHSTMRSMRAPRRCLRLELHTSGCTEGKQQGCEKSPGPKRPWH